MLKLELQAFVQIFAVDNIFSHRMIFSHMVPSIIRLGPSIKDARSISVEHKEKKKLFEYCPAVGTARLCPHV